MDLLRPSEVQKGPDDHVFRHSRVGGVLLLAVLLGGAAVLIEFAHSHAKSGILYVFAGGLILFALLFSGYVFAAFHPTNWLVRMNATGLFIQFRSYLNFRLSSDDCTVLFLSYSEIRSARLIKVKTAVAVPEGHKTTQYSRIVELELAGDTAALAQALADEEGRRAPNEKRWYGSSSTLYMDYPVQMQAPPFLQIRWSARPGARKFVSALGAYTTILETASLSEDFANLPELLSMPQQEQEKRLRELDSRGQTISAIYLLRRIRHCSLAEAKTQLESWRGQPK